MRSGIAAEYADRDAVIAAIAAARAHGATEMEVFSPVPDGAIDAALGARRSPLAIAAGVGGLFGAAAGYALQWFLVAYLYPVDLGGRPAHMPLPYTIITIEMGFLAGALAVVAAFMIAARLGRLWDPVFEIPGFESATRDAFWLVVGDGDGARVEAALRDTDARAVHAFGGGR